MRTRGFTLIEVTLSVSMGLAILILAYSAVRAAGQASAAVHRQALQTELIRVAYIQLINQADNGTPATVTILPAGNLLSLPAVTLTTVGGSAPGAYISTLGFTADPVTGVAVSLPMATHGHR